MKTPEQKSPLEKNDRLSPLDDIVRAQFKEMVRPGPEVFSDIINNFGYRRKKNGLNKYRLPIFKFFDYNDREEVEKEFIEDFGSTLVEFVIAHPELYRMQDFFPLVGLSSETVLVWVNKYPRLKHYYNIAKAIVSSRRDHGALHNRLNAGMVIKSSSFYDEDYRRLEEWRYQQRKEIHAQEGPQVVVIEKLPTSDLVPQKEAVNDVD